MKASLWGVKLCNTAATPESLTKMRFLYLLFAVAFLCSVQAEQENEDEKLQEDSWEALNESQDQDPDVLSADDAAADQGNWATGGRF